MAFPTRPDRDAARQRVRARVRRRPATAPLNVRLFDGIRNAGGRTLISERRRSVSVACRAGACARSWKLPVQMMSLALARLKTTSPANRPRRR
jgi:hypothetical protein